MTKQPTLRTDPSDGLVAVGVGGWAAEKHERLQRYIAATSGVRRKFTNGPGGSAYVDVYSGPGRWFDKDANELTFYDGSPLIAQKAATTAGVQFTKFITNDVSPEFTEACRTRLNNLKIRPDCFVGEAEARIAEIRDQIPPYGYSVAFVDPYNLVPFNILSELACIRRMDLLVHVSVQELQRNLDQYYGDPNSPLEAFAPGITEKLEVGGRKWMRRQVLQYWEEKVKALDMTIGNRIELVTGPRNIPLYHLVMISREPLADRIWSQVAKLGGQHELWTERAG